MRGPSRARHRENEVALPSASFREFGSEAAREFRFERGEDERRVRLPVVCPGDEVSGILARPAAHLSADVEFEFHEIDVPAAKRERFVEPHPGEGEDRDSDPVRLLRVADEGIEGTLIKSTASSASSGAVARWDRVHRSGSA